MVFKMKLRNKKTGEIVDVDFIYPETAEFFYPNFKLVDFNELFEDYEEPKDFWYIDVECGVMCDSTDPDLQDKRYPMEFMKSIGNYFPSREEAEKAVEKLKAWKRLKDKGFSIYSWEYKFDRVDKPARTIILEATVVDATDDLELLFGGEE
jgi:hypothetical protein